MQRRTLILAAVGLPVLAQAHHGWSSFDQGRPIYLEGRATNVKWQNPHAELDLEVREGLRLPADLASRAVPAQSAAVDGKSILARAQLPTRKDKVWDVELAPLTRMEAWKVPPIKNGDTVAVVGFTFQEEKGDPVLRVEYLFVGGRAYGLRSSPA